MKRSDITEDNLVATYSIVACDPETGELGIAVQSKFLAVGAVVPWAKANVGAIATQSWANTSFGPRGLQLLEEGYEPEKVVEMLLENDEGRELRQFAVMDAKGRVAAFTGKECFDWAGHQYGQNCSAQGNILVSEATVQALVETFESAEGTLAERLLAALDTGENAGGDSRGRQSAALYVVKENGGYGGYNDRQFDLRVDDHPEPIEELKRLYDLHMLYFSKTDASALVDIEGQIIVEVEEALQKLGFLETTDSPVALKEALKTFHLQENFDDKYREDNKIDIAVLRFMRGKAAKKVSV
ncbi:putative Ntn-hydrolase superfamily protein [Evansella vedderi]|uniref:Ntn-hydrolase superfamily protein n=1 Tax=Evansella vedderi TaxID=38282 RepID=A0ABT9ZQE3_9BACI|nr:DUF1028 domain-containing protein [Evansella vedderi]MDQ0252942.1 putative Ntn-hydrolase superfamily protein [Evansella vedderi]